MKMSWNVPTIPRKAFTLIELLVVIAIIAVLIGLLIPAVQKVREAANRMACANNLKQLGLAFMNYEGAIGSFPPLWGKDPAQASDVHWPTRLLPWLEQEPLYRQYDRSLAWNDSANLFASTTRVACYLCPSVGVGRSGPNGATGGREYAAIDYTPMRDVDTVLMQLGLVTTTGQNLGVFYSPMSLSAGIRLVEVTDGVSNTLMLGNKRMCCQVRAMPCLARCTVDMPANDLPSKRISPESTIYKPEMRLNKLVLPAPLGPISPNISPA
jgi:prepilin-type N-terminal cleavage/methylation domain-containing protein